MRSGTASTSTAPVRALPVLPTDSREELLQRAGVPRRGFRGVVRCGCRLSALPGGSINFHGLFFVFSLPPWAAPCAVRAVASRDTPHFCGALQNATEATDPAAASPRPFVPGS